MSSSRHWPSPRSSSSSRQSWSAQSPLVSWRGSAVMTSHEDIRQLGAQRRGGGPRGSGGPAGSPGKIFSLGEGAGGRHQGEAKRPPAAVALVAGRYAPGSRPGARCHAFFGQLLELVAPIGALAELSYAIGCRAEPYGGALREPRSSSPLSPSPQALPPRKPLAKSAALAATLVLLTACSGRADIDFEAGFLQRPPERDGQTRAANDVLGTCGWITERRVFVDRWSWREIERKEPATPTRGVRSC